MKKSISAGQPEAVPSASHGAKPRMGTSALEKGLTLLAHICDSKTPYRYSDLLRQTDLPKATLHRMLGALMAHRLITLDPHDQTYRIGVRALEMAQKAWEDMDVRSAATTELAHLAELTEETVHLGVLDEAEVVYIDKVESKQRIRMFSAIGKRGPLHCTGVGKAMAAFLPSEYLRELLGSLPMQGFTSSTITDPDKFMEHLAHIRSVGYAKDLEEHEESIRCVAAPIFDYRGHVIASVSVTAPSIRLTLERLDDFAPLVAQAAERITRNLGGKVIARNSTAITPVRNSASK
ncbi:MAG: IclR family transcriptional regulator [Pusillimonas sp.]